MKTRLYLPFILFIFLQCPAFSQGGWQKIYPTQNGTANGDGINAVRQTADGGYILAGITAHNSGSHNNLVVKVNDLGDIQWSNSYPISTKSWATNIEPAIGGGFYVEGMRRNPVSFYDEVYIQRIDDNGNQIWVNYYPSLNVATKGSTTNDGGYVSFCYDNNTSGGNDSVGIIKIDPSGNTQLLRKYHNALGIPHSVIETSSGEYLVEGFYNYKAFLCKFNNAGDSLWHAVYGQENYHPEYIGKVIENSNGSFTVCSNDALTFGAHDVYLFTTDSSGNILWEQHYGQMADVGTDLAPTYDGGYILCGIENINGANKVLLIKTDGNGNQQWTKTYSGYGTGTFKAYSVRQTLDGGYIVGAAQVSNFYSREHLYLIKTDSLGEIYSNTIQGYVYNDLNANCIVDSSEYRFANRIVEISGTQTYYASTNQSGFYSVRVDTGSYTIILPPNQTGQYWEATTCTNDTLPVSIQNQLTTIDTSFALAALASCPLLEVHLSTVFLRRCFSNDYIIHYCNHGTVPEPNAYIDLSFDSYLLVDTNAIPVPYVSLGANQYRLSIGQVGINECGTLSIPVLVSCNAVLGQSHCSEAAIRPVSTCLLPAWQGAVIGVNAICQNDTILFELSNSGSAGSSALSFLVYNDTLVVDQGSFTINAGGLYTLSYPASSGSTFTLIAQQEPGYPSLLGDSLLIVSIEGCGGAPNTGIVTQFPSYDGSPFIDIDCRQNIGAYDPNDKSALPVGFGVNHYILPETALSYHIRFQNTGTDTAFTVIVRDTISELLDISSFEYVASSHPCTWFIHGVDAQVVDFVFTNIQLPDSNTNEPASHGFVSFQMKQQEGNPMGAIIENMAGIYFDYNEAVITNTTFHELNDAFYPPVVTRIPALYEPSPAFLHLYPNPAKDQITISLPEENDKRNFHLKIYNALGEVVIEQLLTAGKHSISSGFLPSGMYFYAVEKQGKESVSGKLIIGD